MTAKDIYASVLHQQLNIVGFKAALAELDLEHSTPPSVFARVG